MAQRQAQYPAIPPSTPDDWIVHVVPLADSIEHRTDVRERCWCHPEVDEDGEGYVIVHHAADGRELYEMGQRQLS